MGIECIAGYLQRGFARSAAVLLAFLFATACQAADAGLRGSGGVNSRSQQAKPYLILVSIDGFRWDYMDRHPTPNLHRVATAGAKAERLLPVFPTLTFPNHYSIATGLYPAHHGLVANDFPNPARDKWYSLRKRDTVEDPGFYAGEPIWVSAETQGMVSAAFFFVGTEAPVKGVPPSQWRSYDKKIPGEERVDQVLTWLALAPEKRPHVYTLYFEDVDDNSHWYGPDSLENAAAIGRVDGYIGRLLDGIEKLPWADDVNIILLSDHGQGAYVENQQPYLLNEHVDIEGARIVEGGSYLFLYLEREDAGRAAAIAAAVNAGWAHGHAYLPGEAPAQWHVYENPSFPDVILMPDAGYAVLSGMEKVGKINAGDHGWAPEAPDMHGLFVACGPNIKTGVAPGAVRNIDVYPLMLSILGLRGPQSIDGKAANLADILYTDRSKQTCFKH